MGYCAFFCMCLNVVLHSGAVMKRCLIAHSSKKNGVSAFAEILDQLECNGDNSEPILLIFASDCDNFGWYSKMLSDQFYTATVIGLTSLELYAQGRVLRGGISVIAIYEGITVSSGVLLEASRYPKRYSSVIEEAYREIGTDENTAVIEFNASEIASEELIMDTFDSVIGDTGIRMIGGTAAKGMNPVRPSAVSLDGTVYLDATVFVMVHNEMGRIDIIRENIFESTDHFYVATDVDVRNRRVYEFNHQPAAGVVAKSLEVTVDDFSENVFFHPLGKVASDELSVVGFDKVYEDESVSFFSRIYNQTKVYLLKPVSSLENVWQNTSYRMHKSIENPAFSFAVSSYSRTRYFNEIGVNDEFAETLQSNFGDYMCVSVQGEQMDYEHLNQTMLIISFE